MGAHQSKEELLYQQVNYGNVEGIKSLRRDGAGLEWIDKEGKTPLILACMRPDHLNVVKVLIELGANVNAYRPGLHAGTPLHHAAKRGLDQTVNLLLSYGANPLVMNDDCQTPLDLARAKGHCNVVRVIESRICLFCGWLREIFGPSILEAFAPQWVSRKIWAVVLPCDSRNPTTPSKYELAIYPDLQVAAPRVVIQLWKAQIEEPKFNQPDPTLVLVDKASSKIDRLSHGFHCRTRPLGRRKLHMGQLSKHLDHRHRRRHSKNHENHRDVPSASSGGESAESCLSFESSSIPAQTESGPKSHSNWRDILRDYESRYKFLSAHEGDKEQLQRFYNACRGIRQNAVITPVAPPGAAPTANSTHLNSHPPPAPVPAHSQLSEDVQLTMAINASIQSAMAEGIPITNPQQGPTTTTTNGWGPSSETTTAYNGWGHTGGAPPPSSKTKPASDPYNGWSGVRPSSSSPQLHTGELETPTVNALAHEAPPTVSVPSAPPIIEETFFAGPVQYPTIDSSPVDLTALAIGNKKNEAGGSKEGSSSSSGDCVICLDAPVEGACIPCGHMAGCMSCLNEIKGKNWGCPVCRAKIDQVVRLYVVSG